ncbi:hypothetical protein Q6304_30815, partial [Klebsiella pneumoniae]
MPGFRAAPAPVLAGNPLISIIIPCYNEGDNAADTIHADLAGQAFTLHFANGWQIEHRFERDRL